MKQKNKLPEGWKEVEFKDIEDKNNPYPIGDGDHGKIKPSMYQTLGVPYIRVGDMVKDYISLKEIVYISEEVHNQNIGSELIPDDLIIAKTGATIGKVAIIPSEIKKANTTSSVGKITLNKKLAIPKYVLYFMKTSYFKDQMWAVSKKSAQPGFNIKDLKCFKIPLPPLPTQKLIVSILERAESLKQKREEADKLTKEYLQSVFYEMFGNPKPALNKFSSIKLGEVARITMGGTPSTAINNYWQNGTINWMKSGDIKGDFIFSVPNRITNLGLENSNTELYPKGTVVIALNGQGKTRGTTAVLRIETTSNQSVSGIILNKEKILPEYLLYNLKMRYQELRSMTGDDDRSGLNLTILRNFQIPLPPLPLQQKFASIVEHIEKLKEKQQQSKEEIGLIFDSLMQKAFKGELVR